MKRKKNLPRPSFMDTLKVNNTINLLGDVLGTKFDADKMKDLFENSNPEVKHSKNSFNSSIKYDQKRHQNKIQHQTDRIRRVNNGKYENSLSSTSQRRNTIEHISNSSVMPGEITFQTNQSSTSKNYDFRTNRFNKFQRSATQKMPQTNHGLSIFNESLNARRFQLTNENQTPIRNKKNVMVNPQIIRVKSPRKEEKVANSLNIDSPTRVKKTGMGFKTSIAKIHNSENFKEARLLEQSHSEGELSIQEERRKKTPHGKSGNIGRKNYNTTPRKHLRSGSFDSDKSAHLREMRNSDRESLMDFGNNKIEYAESINFSNMKFGEKKNIKNSERDIKKKEPSIYEKSYRRHLSMRERESNDKPSFRSKLRNSEQFLINPQNFENNKNEEETKNKKEDKTAIDNQLLKVDNPKRVTRGVYSGLIRPKSILKMSAYDINNSRSHHEIALSVRTHMSPSKRIGRRQRVRFSQKHDIFEVESYKEYNKHSAIQAADSHKVKSCCCNLQ